MAKKQTKKTSSKKDLAEFRQDIEDEIKSNYNRIRRDLSRLERVQNRTTDRLKKSSRKLKNAVIFISILTILLVGAVVWMIIAISNLSTQIAQRKSTAQFGQNTSNTIISDHSIDLSKKDTDITLAESGEYWLTGKTTHTITVTGEEDVTLHLANVSIVTDKDFAIKYTSEKNLTIDLMPDTANILTSNGAGQGNGTLYSAGILSISGSGSLEASGAQKYGNGLATKNFYAINGGNVLILGSDMIERPMLSQQKSLEFALNTTVKNGSSVQIRNQRGAILHSFVATQDFQTLIWSQPDLTAGNYSLFVDGKVIDVLMI